MNKKQTWLVIFVIIITLLSLFLRFYNLGFPEKITSDEHYFVNFGRAYVSQEFYHDVHPPLGKFFIALGIKIFGDNALGWRFFTALFGSLLVPLGYLLAWKMFNNKFIAVSFSLFILFDGLFFVQSRLARLDTIYLFFLFLAFYFFFSFLKSHKDKEIYLILSGLFLGFSISTKWVALAGGLSFLIIWLIKKKEIKKSIIWFLFYLVFIPLAIYFLIWQIHYGLISTQPITFYENFKILTYHQGIKEVHSLGSPFWSWPLMIYPFSYFIEKSEQVIKYITDLPNPLIWWPALVGFLYGFFKFRLKDKKFNIILIIFASHFLPYLFISRSLFLYHFILAAPFLWLGFLYFLSKFWYQSKKSKIIILGYFALVIISFVFFYPVLIGQPLSTSSFNLRWWLISWFPLAV
ncbi:MAG: phospholipid carrier-dependent glycosyltransferase [Patescibacteria group bacterium]|nr:phospholipid carrier-dependent glycosyltransferase [Patescibacteria group bacterium]